MHSSLARPQTRSSYYVFAIALAMLFLAVAPAHATVITPFPTVIFCQVNVSCSNQIVAVFEDDNPLASPGDFTATIDWGDGSHTTGTIGIDDPFFSVIGTHTYTLANTYTITVVISDAPPGTGMATVMSTATVTANPPTISKMFGASTIAPGASTSLSFTIQNTAPIPITMVGFTDTLPPGLVVSTPNGITGSCGGGTIMASGSTISLSGASLPVNGSCTFSVNVTATASAGLQNNMTTPVTSAEEGNGNSATASITVTPALPPSITKMFGRSTTSAGFSVPLTFTIQNGNLIPLTGVGFTDALTGGLTVSTPNGVINNCGGTVTAVAGSTNITLAGATVAPSTSCTVTVNVTPTANGTINNITGVVTSIEGGPGNTASATLIVATFVSGTLDGSYQTKVFSNLPAGDSIINIGNTGASAAAPTGGSLCINVYVFSPDEQEVACCSCFVTPNGVVTTTARQLITKTLTPAVPTALTVKLLATDGAGGAASCNPAAPGAPMAGLIAFGTNLHTAPVGGAITAGTFATTETAFVPSTLSAAELARISTLCGFIEGNGTGFGVCPGCATGAAGAAKQ